MQILFGLILYLAVYFVSAGRIFAASLTLDSGVTNLTPDNPDLNVKIHLNIDSPDDTGYYLRGVFYQPDSSNYCGYTWNNSIWFSGPYSSADGWKQFLSVRVKSSSWSGELKARIDPADTGCRSSGEYRFKVQRFTESGSGTFDSQNELTVNVMIPTNTPTPMPTNTPAPTSVPTRTPTPIKTPTPMPTAVIGEEVDITAESLLTTTRKTTLPTIPLMPSRDQKSELSSSEAGTVMGDFASAAGIATATPVNQNITKSRKTVIISLLFVGAGSAMMATAYLFKNRFLGL